MSSTKTIDGNNSPSYASFPINPDSTQSLPSVIAPRKKQCGLLLKDGISIWNFFSYLLLIYLMVLGFLMTANFFILLIQDARYYVVSEQELGQVQGALNTYISIITLPIQFVAGFILDSCGRRTTLTICAFVSAIMLTILPYGHNLYPGLLLIKTILLSALEIIVISPLLADYVKDKTKGLAGGYLQLVSGISATVFSFGFLELAEHIDLAYICWIVGGVSFLISVYCLFFITDSYSRNNRRTQRSSELNNSSEETQSSCWDRAFESISYSCRVTRKRKMLIAVYLTGITQRVLDLSFVTIISVWVSKYVYDGDIPKISHHNKITLGVANIAVIPLGLLFGYAYDRCGELVTLSFVFFCAGFPYIVLYFLEDVNSVFGFGLQIFGTIFSILTNAMGSIMIGRHSPKQGVGKVYAFRSFVAGLFLIGFNYLSGWMIDQSFSKVTFLLIGAIALSQVIMFLSILACCKNISEITSEDDDAVFLLSSQVKFD